MDKVRIEPASPSWPEAFMQIAGRLRSAIGKTAVRVDHIGSTAVPGLAAKDVIDVQVTVASLKQLDADAIGAAGFQVDAKIVGDHRPPGAEGPDAQWAKRFARQSSGRRTHIHIRAAGAPNERYALLFRDYLRADPDAAAAYELAKRGLASLAPDSAAYADLKDPVCDLVIIAAERWAKATGWEPAPSDA